jgi:lipopolysaccharide/colanic/teichoic acid biosynthesis glycosyltransferase
MGLLNYLKIFGGFLFAIGTPPYLAFGILKITRGEPDHIHILISLLLIGICCSGASWILGLRGLAYERFRLFWERPLVLLLLLIFSPLLLLFSILIKLESGGPAIYSQQRIGKNRRRTDRRKKSGCAATGRPFDRRKEARRKEDFGGRPFNIYKLRSMYQNAESETGAAWSTGDSDPRVTRIGYFIRKTHIDELPQLMNVLLGQMSLIGPRPERPSFVAELNDVVKGYRARLNVPAGITGLAQVYQHADETVEDVKKKLDYDRKYIEEMSLLLDCKIILLTVFLVLRLFWDARRRKISKYSEPKPPTSLIGDYRET